MLPTSEQPTGVSTPRALSWRISVAAVLLIGAALRLHNLALVPLHHDEGVNGKFLLSLVNDGFYRYDPQNYHGPTLYYFAAIIPWLSRIVFGRSFADLHGVTDFTIRLTTAAFGVATIWLILTLRRHLGAIGAMAAAALLALSPGAIYLSRYFIHETLFVFFMMALIIAALRFYETARSLYLMLAATAAALMFATKETAIIGVAVLAIAALLTKALIRIRGLAGAKEQPVSNLSQRLHNEVERFGGVSSILISSVAAASIFLIVEILFYSSFFTNYPNGVIDALKSLNFWAQTGVQTHVHPWPTYILWLLSGESTLLLLGALGLFLALWRGSNAFAIFIGLSAFGLLVAYSLIPYKTPWLMLSFVVPLAATSGYVFQYFYERAKPTKLLVVLIAVAAAALLLSAYQAVMLNFAHYDDPTYAYVYVHTERDIFPLLDRIQHLSKQAAGEQTPVAILSPDYWPLPWYLRKYSHVRYYSQVAPFQEPIVIASSAQIPEIITMSGVGYRLLNSNLNPNGTYTLRPGIELVVFIRSDLAD